MLNVLVLGPRLESTIGAAVTRISLRQSGSWRWVWSGTGPRSRLGLGERVVCEEVSCCNRNKPAVDFSFVTQQGQTKRVEDFMRKGLSAVAALVVIAIVAGPAACGLLD